MKEKRFLIEDKVVFWSGLIYLAAMLLFLLLKGLAYFGVFAPMGQWAGYFFTILVQVGLMGILPLLLYKLFNKKTFKQTFQSFSFRTISWKTVLFSALLGICMYVLVVYISSFWSAMLSWFGYQHSSSSTDYSTLKFFLTVLFVAVLPGFFEEFMHRGMVLGSTRKNGIIRACLLCGLLFGLLHFNAAQFGYAWIVGVFLCLVTVLTRSIWPAIIMHFMNNFIGTYITFASVNDWFLGAAFNASSAFLAESNVVVVMLVNLLVLTLVCSLGSWLLMKMFAEAKKRKFQKFHQQLRRDMAAESVPSVDLNNPQEVLGLYQQVSMLNAQKKLAEGNFTMEDLNGFSNRKALDVVLSDDFSLPQKRKRLDYIFYYIAIVVGIAGTLAEFILNIL